MDNCFLVCVNFALVAKDVTATLQQKGMGRPLVAATQTEAIAALQALTGDGVLRIAVVQMPPALFAASPLHTVLKVLGVPVILLDDGPASDATDMVYRILSLPFFTEDLERVIVELMHKS